MVYTFFLLLMFINPSGKDLPLENFIEVEIKYTEQNYIQLFTISEDSIASFTEKQSYWHQLGGDSDFQKVKWNLRDVVYNKFRIDLSTQANQTIEIKSILMHVNNEIIKLNGKEILAFFEPNIFLTLISADSESIVFESVEINDYTNPGISQMNDKMTFNLKSNTNVEILLKCSQRGVLAIGLTDEESGTYGRSIYIDSSITQISLPLFLKSKPTSINIQPSISNENEILFKEVSLAYGDDKIVWDGNDIKSKFKYNGNYYKFGLQNSEYFVKTKLGHNTNTFLLWNSDFEFSRDFYIRIAIGGIVLFIMFFVLIYVNIFLLKKDSTTLDY